VVREHRFRLARFANEPDTPARQSDGMADGKGWDPFFFFFFSVTIANKLAADSTAMTLTSSKWATSRPAAEPKPDACRWAPFALRRPVCGL